MVLLERLPASAGDGAAAQTLIAGLQRLKRYGVGGNRRRAADISHEHSEQPRASACRRRRYFHA